MRITRNSFGTVYYGVIAIVVLLSVLGVVNAASIRNQETDNHFGIAPIGHQNARQSSQLRYSDDSDEYVDENEDELVREQYQQNLWQQQQLLDDSEEASDEEDDGDNDADDERRRRRRDVKVGIEEQDQDETTVASVVEATIPPARNTSVLILIRDALKKVTNELPTQQVATNALQYFQLFEHFLQQTIEQVIGDDDEEEEEEASPAAPSTESNLKPASSEIPTEGANNNETNKEPEKVNFQTEAGDKPIAAATTVDVNPNAFTELPIAVSTQDSF